MADTTFSVLVFDMARTGEPDGERQIDGFSTAAAARAYAEARMRASLEELRTENQTASELSTLWHIYGEDCVVLDGSFSGRDNLAHYIATPATPEACDWPALAPTRPGLLKLRRFHATLMIQAVGLSGLDKFVWAGGFLTHAEKPTRAELLEIYREDARAAFARKGYPDVTLEQANIVHVFELPDPPLPSPSGRPLLNWKVVVDFVCHDIKFGSTAQGIFQWPEAPAGDVLRQMQNVVMADALTLRGDGPDWVESCEVHDTQVSATSEPPTYA
jgi:hypothetical protein